jgi:hypothetical protein
MTNLVATYQTQPKTVEAFQWNEGLKIADLPKWADEQVKMSSDKPHWYTDVTGMILIIKTDRGAIYQANPTDWIIRDHTEDLDVMDNDAFTKIYAPKYEE